VSPKQLRLLARRLPTQCNFDRLDPTTSLRRAAFYDVLHVDLSWQQVRQCFCDVRKSHNSHKLLLRFCH
jgi:hypothetical protein